MGGGEGGLENTLLRLGRCRRCRSSSPALMAAGPWGAERPCIHTAHAAPGRVLWHEQSADPLAVHQTPCRPPVHPSLT